MTLTKLNGNESGVIIAKLINALIDEKASVDLSDLDATGEQRFTDINTAISTLQTALSTLTTTVNKKVEATVSLAANGYIKFDNGLLIQWVTILPGSTGSNLAVSYPLMFTEIYSIAGIAGCHDANISTSKSPFHDTVVARSALLQLGTELSYSDFKGALWIRRPDSGYRYSYIAIGKY